MSRHRRLGLRARATVAWASIALMLSASLAMFAYQLTRVELIDDRVGRAMSQAYLNARLLRSGLRSSEPDVNAILSSLEGNAGSASIARVEGQWFAGSVGPRREALPSSLTAAVADGRAGRQLTAIGGEPHVAVGVPIAESRVRYFELVSLEDIDDALGSLARGLTVGALLATLVAAVAGWYASGRVLTPLGGMADAAARIAEGNLKTRLDALGDRDLEPLQRSFNRMADAVEARIEREHRFTADVSHEVRSPLAAMLSAISIARRRRGDPDAIDEALRQLEERTEAFHHLVDDLLEISRVDAGVAELELEPVDPRELIRAVLATGSDGDVPIEVTADVPAVVHADKRRLGRMVMNLIENADRYGGGTTKIQLSRSNDMLRIAVEDNGPGVPEHERSHVFGRFARGEDARNSAIAGTGLGLALVDENAHLHGGSVSVETASGGGARFVIQLPIGGRPA